MGFKSFFNGFKGMWSGKTEASKPKIEDAFMKTIRQSPVELETEFILNVAAAFNEITIEEVKPNLYCFAPPQRSAKECPAELNVIVGPVRSTHSSLKDPSTEHQVSAEKTAASDKSHTACPPAHVMSRNDFEIIRSIGQGTQGQLFLALNLKTESFVAVEIIEKTGLDAAACVRLFEQQRMARSLADCAWSLGMEGSFEDSMNFYIVTPFAPGGDLNKLLQIDSSLSIFAKKSILADILVALQELHKRDIVYCDLRLEHILFDTDGRVLLSPSSLAYAPTVTPEDRPWEIAPTFAKKPASPPRAGSVHSHSTGSSGFVAPEVLSGEVPTSQADVFGLGVLVHFLIYGFMPFGIISHSQSPQEIRNRTINIPLDLEQCDYVTPGALHLIEKMLEKDPYKRMTMAQVRAHPVFREINLKNIDARIISDAHKQAVFRYAAPSWVNASQIPAAGEPYENNKVPCPWFVYTSVKEVSSASSQEAVNLSSFNPLILPATTPVLIPVRSPVVSTSTFLAATRANRFEPDSGSEFTTSTPRLSLSSSMSSHSGAASSVSSVSRQTPDVDVFGTVVQLAASSIFESAIEYHGKQEEKMSAESKSLNDTRTVAWWKF